MVAGGHDIGPGFDCCIKDRLGNAKAVGRILAIDHHKIGLHVADQTRQLVEHGHSPGLADHVTQKQQTHGNPYH